MENLSAMRVPATIGALLILGLRIAAAVLGTVAFSGAGPRPSAISAAEYSHRAIDPALVLVTVLLVASCILVRPVSAARTLARAAAVVVGLSILVALTLAVLGASRGGWRVGLDTLDTVLLLAVPLLGFLALVRLTELAPTPTRRAQDTAGAALTSGGPGDGAQPGPAPDPALEPTWQPDVAAGAAWHTAGDAAAGAPASGWGTPGESADWSPRAVGAEPEVTRAHPSGEAGGKRPPDAGDSRPGATPEDDPAH